MLKNIFIPIAVLGIVLGFISVSKNDTLGSISSSKCSVSSTELASVGQTSTSILSADETRAWASIQVIGTATSNISLSFDEGASAVANEGYVIATSTPYSINSPNFGRATLFPYTGAVTAIAPTASTSVLITQCSY